ncbi:Uma2 family endonuclease [Stieleria varia]|uniref:Putative restriction endonuclease domain-containing protein n=1 Tax=Stieleria varia TaxID=2528005 RepID=A0A5C6ALI1_9BACT|nr:Uma2 family endonuclease [Stieleria varia]TWU00883.1 hypothetical protein Pla52n_42520 [Stieleria varia]
MHSGEPALAMSNNLLKLSAAEYDQMIAKGAFDGINRRIEMIRGELREMNPAGPLHCDYVNFLNRWSTSVTLQSNLVIQVQSGIDLQDSRPEPDITWLKPGRYSKKHPGADDILLLIEVADSSVDADLGEKARLYAEHRIVEYWVVDIAAKCVHSHRDSNGREYATYQVVDAGGEIAPSCQPEIALKLPELFVG